MQPAENASIVVMDVSLVEKLWRVISSGPGGSPVTVNPATYVFISKTTFILGNHRISNIEECLKIVFCKTKNLPLVVIT